MRIKEITKEAFEEFVTKSGYNSFYQSIEWYNLKTKENKKCELLGLYDGKKLVGVSLVIYLKILRNYYMAYASRGFVYNYQNISDFKESLNDYFKNKNVVFFRMDPPLILATYDTTMSKKINVENSKLIDDLKNNGFKHYGFNSGFETNQFRFVHRLKVEKSFDEQFLLMGKSTKKNISLANQMGVKIKRVGIENLDDVFNLFECTTSRKQIEGFSKQFYENLIEEFKDNIVMYIAYIDKSKYKKNLVKKLEDAKKDLDEIKQKMKHDHVGVKLKKQEEIALNNVEKYTNELDYADTLEDYTNIASMMSIFKYNEVVSLASGMNNKYRRFCPKYAMYPAMIIDAINKGYEYVNFLGVKNIMDKSDPAYGVYEVKRGFGGDTIEYIGEFDLPFKKFLYKIYKLKENKERGK